MSLYTDALESGICPACQEPKTTIDQQYSYGVYAGVMCTDCAKRNYNDQCGHGMPQGSPNDLDEPYWED
jgi:hypothetical protein